MGWNSVLFILHDGLDQIEKDPQGFVDLLTRKLGGGVDGEGEYSFGNHCNVLSIPHIGHADGVALIAAGGNYATKILTSYSTRGHHEEDGQIILLREFADKLGYQISRKPGKIDEADEELIVEAIKDGHVTFAQLCKHFDAKGNSKRWRGIDRKLQRLRKKGLIHWIKPLRQWEVNERQD